MNDESDAQELARLVLHYEALRRGMKDKARWYREGAAAKRELRAAKTAVLDKAREIGREMHPIELMPKPRSCA